MMDNSNFYLLNPICNSSDCGFREFRLYLYMYYGLVAFIAERLSARHLILQHALGQRTYVCMYVCMYICPSRSSTHVREDGGGVTRERTCAIRSSSRVGWMAGVRLKETEERLQHLQQCVPVSMP